MIDSQMRKTHIPFIVVWFNSPGRETLAWQVAIDSNYYNKRGIITRIVAAKIFSYLLERNVTTDVLRNAKVFYQGEPDSKKYKSVIKKTEREYDKKKDKEDTKKLKEVNDPQKKFKMKKKIEKRKKKISKKQRNNNKIKQEKFDFE